MKIFPQNQCPISWQLIPNEYSVIIAGTNYDARHFLRACFSAFEEGPINPCTRLPLTKEEIQAMQNVLNISKDEWTKLWSPLDPNQIDNHQNNKRIKKETKKLIHPEYQKLSTKRGLMELSEAEEHTLKYINFVFQYEEAEAKIDLWTERLKQLFLEKNISFEF